jgi:hypothetical protein
VVSIESARFMRRILGKVRPSDYIVKERSSTWFEVSIDEESKLITLSSSTCRHPAPAHAMYDILMVRVYLKIFYDSSDDREMV